MDETLNEISTGGNTPNSSSKNFRPKQERLMSRFYEPLVLLHTLDRNGGQRISRCPSREVTVPEKTRQELKRDFLDQLAYICDYVKGGTTVTAIALEKQPSGVVFWISCNTNFTLKSMCFLRGILSDLKSLVLSSDEDSDTVTESDLTERCIDFNLPRIKEYQKLLIRNLRECLKILVKSERAEDKLLMHWLKSFKVFKADLLGLCRYAYQERSSPFLKELNRNIGDEMSELLKIQSNKQVFYLTRHYIGRLGSHLKASKVLIMASQRLADLFDSYTIETRPAPKPALEPPPTDRLTTLEGIVKRMFPGNSVEFKQYQEDLKAMDEQFGIQNSLLDEYKDRNFRPRVHAELILLEHFYKERLPFVDDDKFIGCSKPACYCCYQYISAHPGGFELPSSHGNRYLSWRPPDEDDSLKKKNHQLKIMNKVIARIRLDVLQQIRQRRRPSPWYPDSTSGITYSMNFGKPKQQVALVQSRGVGIEEFQEETKNEDFSDHEVEIDEVLDHEQEYETPAPTHVTPPYIVNENNDSDSEGGASL